MNYIYDILLNYNNYFFDFFDWNKNDNITEIRKIPIFKINSKVFHDIKDNYVKFDNSFVDRIRNKTEYFVGRTIKLMTSFLITDGIDIMGIKLDKKLKYSSLQIDEELDILEEINLDTYDLKYQIVSKIKKDNFKTRYQIEQEKIIKDTMKQILRENNISKIKYIYYECFNEKESNIDKIIQKLNREISNKEILSKLSNIINSSKITNNINL